MPIEKEEGGGGGKGTRGRGARENGVVGRLGGGRGKKKRKNEVM